MAHSIRRTLEQLSGPSILRYLDGASTDGADAARSALEEPVGPFIEQIHATNAGLWQQEDLARRRSAPDGEIVGNKRAIDALNQRRNDLVERCDDVLHAALESSMASAARLNSETPGQMIDRLSILSLKIAAMKLQVARSDVDESHRAACRAKLAHLVEQRNDLAGCLDALLADCAAGRARFKLYRQFKMYNDPTLNPALVAEREKR